MIWENSSHVPQGNFARNSKICLKIHMFFFIFYQFQSSVFWMLDRETHHTVLKRDLKLLNNTQNVKFSPCGRFSQISSHYVYIQNKKADSYTPRTLRACCSQSNFRILKICESSAHALFLYNCTPNISRSDDVSVSVA